MIDSVVSSYREAAMSSSTDPIVRVSVISTGSVRMRPEHVGPTWKPLPVWVLTSTRWTELRPINVYVIEHREGLVLFDTGLDRASVTEPSYFPGRLDRLVNARIAKVEIGPDDTFRAGLAGRGYRVDDVVTAVISHLHMDHVGGLPQLGHARIVVSAAEWSTLGRPRPEARGLYPQHIDLPGLRWDRITPEPLADPAVAPFTAGHDLFGDGSIVLLPTPGHTPGSLSMLVRRPDRTPLLMIGDLAYDALRLAAGQVSGMCDRKQTRHEMSRVNALRETLPEPGVVLFLGCF